MKTKMLQEIEEQPEVALRVIADHRGRAADVERELSRKRSVLLCGTGASLNACQAARYAFLRYSTLFPTVVDATDIPHYAARIGSDTQVILVSQSGNSAETVVAAEHLLSRGIPLWGLTNDPESMLGRSSTRLFPLQAGVEVSSATKTYTASVLILYLLAAGAQSAARAKIERIPDAIARTREDCADAVARLRAELDGSPPVLIGGVGALSAVAPQGALLLKEKVLIHAEGMPMTELRHGPVEILRPGFPVIVVSGGDATRDQARLHVDYLAGLGAAVWSVRDLPGEGNVVLYIGGVDETLCHIAATIPFQLLAESMASSRGYDVDGFRYLSKVLTSYERQTR